MVSAYDLVVYVTILVFLAALLQLKKRVAVEKEALMKLQSLFFWQLYCNQSKPGNSTIISGKLQSLFFWQLYCNACSEVL